MIVFNIRFTARFMYRNYSCILETGRKLYINITESIKKFAHIGDIRSATNLSVREWNFFKFRTFRFKRKYTFFNLNRISFKIYTTIRGSLCKPYRICRYLRNCRVNLISNWSEIVIECISILVRISHYTIIYINI